MKSDLMRRRIFVGFVEETARLVKKLKEFLINFQDRVIL